MKLFKFLGCIYFFVASACVGQQKQDKIDGISFVASRDAINQLHVAPVVNINANYAAIMPFGFIRELEHPEIIFNTERQWFGETRKGAKQYVEELRKGNIKIMVKPQIWVSRGEFTGFIKMNSEDNWKALEDSYSKFILEYASLSQEINAEIFCIGTELENFIASRPQFWETLIIEVKKVYKGKLTYAANWNEYTKTPFWEQLDYIGIDAYFPVSELKTPTIEDCKAGWESHKSEIKTYSKTFNKPILFTEFGYRSVDFSGKAPWRSDREMGDVNMEAQLNTTQALFEMFWHEDWFAGGFIWKWFHDHERVGGKDNSQFTPQNKPVEAIVKTYYSK
ncbi:glycoside hydrolase [Geojedonia litorea]|uniref:Glycoside hydrolase n=1 Tax=Geojedonia litorea TaxID=1268269 RepID=A0ABV9N652_9FLAO